MPCWLFGIGAFCRQITLASIIIIIIIVIFIVIIVAIIIIIVIIVLIVAIVVELSLSLLCSLNFSRPVSHFVLSPVLPLPWWQSQEKVRVRPNILSQSNKYFITVKQRFYYGQTSILSWSNIYLIKVKQIFHYSQTNILSK